MENFSFISVDGTPTRYPGNTCLPKSKRSFRKQSKPNDTISRVQADVIRDKHRERVISSRIVLRWKETDTGYKGKARWCVHGFEDPDIHEIERSCPMPADPGVDNVRGDVGRRGESIHAR